MSDLSNNTLMMIKYIENILSNGPSLIIPDKTNKYIIISVFVQSKNGDNNFFNLLIEKTKLPNIPTTEQLLQALIDLARKTNKDDFLIEHAISDDDIYKNYEKFYIVNSKYIA